ncbi:taurine catabolism dioxygenase, TauD/TfdA family protein, partial [Rhizoctonia solani AG-3 Rhs1AP]
MAPLHRQISGTSGTLKPAAAAQSSLRTFPRFKRYSSPKEDKTIGASPRGEQYTEGIGGMEQWVTIFGCAIIVGVLIAYILSTKQRLVNTFEIPPDVQPVRAESRPTGLEVTWSESPRHTSTFPWEWLSRSSYDPPIKYSPTFNSSRKTLWDSSIQQSPPIVSYEEVMKNDTGVYKWLQKIDEFGFCFISGVPPNPQDTETLTRRIAFIHGGFWDFTSDLEHGDTAYTNLALGAHTDTTYLISAHAAGDADSLYIPDEPFSILKKDLKGELMRVRYNNDDRSVLKFIDPVLVDDWYDALRSWNQCLTSPDAELWVQLTAGTAVVVDNHRVLHGADEWKSRLRVLSQAIDRQAWNSEF